MFSMLSSAIGDGSSDMDKSGAPAARTGVESGGKKVHIAWWSHAAHIVHDDGGRGRPQELQTLGWTRWWL